MSENCFVEQEIDIIELLWSILEQWRIVLIVGLASALLSVGISMLSDIRNSEANNEVLENQSEIAVENEVSLEAPEIEELDPIDIDLEYQTACTVLSQYVSYCIQKDSYSKTVLGNFDFEDCRIVSIVYEFSLNENNKSLLVVTNLYSSITDNGDFNSKLAEVFSKDIDSNSIYDIVSIGVSANANDADSTKGTITVRTVLPNSIDVETWKTELNAAIQEYYSNVSNRVCQHSLRRIAVNVKETAGTSQISSQNTKQADIATAKNTYESTLKSLHEPTQNLIKNIIKENDNEYKYNAYINQLNDGWNDNIVALQEEWNEENTEFQNQQLELIEESDIDNTEDVIETTAEKEQNHICKNAVLGFIIGIFLYTCCYMGLYIFFRVVRNEDELSSITGTRNFGGIYEYPYKKKIEIFLHDERIYNYRHRKSRKVIEVSNDLLVKLKYSKVNNLTAVVTSKTDDKLEVLLSEQIVYLKESGIDICTLNINDGQDSFSDATLANMKNAFLVLIGNKTKYSVLEPMYRKFKEYDVAVVGYEYIEM